MRYFEKMTWPECQRAIHPERWVILPIGAIEAHGPHLPLNTDNIIARELAARLGAALDGLVLPVLPFGQVWSLKDFPGSLTFSTETLERVVVELAVSLYRHGVRRLILLNAHFGNNQSLKEAARQVMEDYPDIHVLYFSHPGLNRLVQGIMETERPHPAYVHADEIETSLLLAFQPEDVRMELAVREYPQFPASFDYTPTPWGAVTKSGVLGDPTKATAAKGELLAQRLVEEMVKIVRSWEEEHRG